MFKLPPITTEIDAEGLHEEYAGIKVGLVLNPPYPDYEEPEEKVLREQPWLAKGWFYRASRLAWVRVPGHLTDSGEEERVEIGSAQALYELESREDFDPIITTWAATAWVLQRDELLQKRAKN